MVRSSHLSRSHHASSSSVVPTDSFEESKRGGKSSQDRPPPPPRPPRRNRSPGGSSGRRKTPPRQSSPWHPSSDMKGADHRSSSRSRHRVEYRSHDSKNGSNRDMKLASNNSRKLSKRPKWRRNRNKKKGRGKGRAPPPLSGGNRAPVSGGNRQPIASMRMRMDDYVAPRTGRLLPLGKSNDIEHAVAKARREASTRTKDTFWTKKLLDAESSHPNRWAHSGFKELYREELGYSELEYKEREKEKAAAAAAGSRHSPARGDYDRKRPPRSSPSDKQKTSPNAYSSSRKTSTFLSKPKTDFRKRGANSRSRSRSPRGKTHHSSRHASKVAPPSSATRKSSSYLRPNKRPYSHSLSRSPSSISSPSQSDSRSFSSYSYSSSHSSSSSSSSFSSSTSRSLRSYRRSYSRSSKSWSRSPSIVRLPPAKIKTDSLSKAVQSVHANKEKSRKLTKTVSNVIQSKTYFMKSGIKAKSKHARIKGPPEVPIITLPPASSLPHHRHSVPIVPPTSVVPPPPNDFYEKDLPITKTTSFIEPPVDPNQFPAEAQNNFKVPHITQSTHQHVSITQTTVQSEGEQSNSDSSTDDDDIPLKMTLSERFGKLAQLSSQRQEYEGVRMKIVREGGQDKKVYLEGGGGGGGSRSPSPGVGGSGRRSNGAHERWLREHKAEYDEYEERYGEFRQWDPHRDLPRELPPNWDDINVRFRYYKESGYFGERSITMEDYLKWEEWWYRYRDWLEKYGGSQEESLKYRGGPYSSYEVPRGSTRDRWMRRENHRDKEDRKRHRY